MLNTKLHLDWANYRPYTHENVHSHAPTSAGVYKLAYPNADNLIVFYIGQADNLDTRLKEHLSDSEQNQCIKQKLARGDCQFTYAVVPNKNDRDGAERALYDYFKPVCNLIVPPGPAISINPTNN